MLMRDAEGRKKESKQARSYKQGNGNLRRLATAQENWTEMKKLFSFVLTHGGLDPPPHLHPHSTPHPHPLHSSHLGNQGHMTVT